MPPAAGFVPLGQGEDKCCPTGKRPAHEAAVAAVAAAAGGGGAAQADHHALNPNDGPAPMQLVAPAAGGAGVVEARPIKSSGSLFEVLPPGMFEFVLGFLTGSGEGSALKNTTSLWDAASFAYCVDADGSPLSTSPDDEEWGPGLPLPEHNLEATEDICALSEASRNLCRLVRGARRELRVWGPLVEGGPGEEEEELDYEALYRLLAACPNVELLTVRDVLTLGTVSRFLADGHMQNLRELRFDMGDYPDDIEQPGISIAMAETLGRALQRHGLPRLRRLFLRLHPWWLVEDLVIPAFFHGLESDPDGPPREYHRYMYDGGRDREQERRAEEQEAMAIAMVEAAAALEGGALPPPPTAPLLRRLEIVGQGWDEEDHKAALLWLKRRLRRHGQAVELVATEWPVNGGREGDGLKGLCELIVPTAKRIEWTGAHPRALHVVEDALFELGAPECRKLVLAMRSDHMSEQREVVPEDEVNMEQLARAFSGRRFPNLQSLKLRAPASFVTQAGVDEFTRALAAAGAALAYGSYAGGNGGGQAGGHDGFPHLKSLDLSEAMVQFTDHRRLYRTLAAPGILPSLEHLAIRLFSHPSAHRSHGYGHHHGHAHHAHVDPAAALADARALAEAIQEGGLAGLVTLDLSVDRSHAGFVGGQAPLHRPLPVLLAALRQPHPKRDGGGGAAGGAARLGPCLGSALTSLDLSGCGLVDADLADLAAALAAGCFPRLERLALRERPPPPVDEDVEQPPPPVTVLANAFTSQGVEALLAAFRDGAPCARTLRWTDILDQLLPPAAVRVLGQALLEGDGRLARLAALRVWMTPSSVPLPCVARATPDERSQEEKEAEATEAMAVLGQAFRSGQAQGVEVLDLSHCLGLGPDAWWPAIAGLTEPGAGPRIRHLGLPQGLPAARLTRIRAAFQHSGFTAYGVARPIFFFV